jgi:acyl CoA:acetate/3-ketoacid CoA transferase beta subunit
VNEDVCVLALAEAFRGDGEIFASPMGPVPVKAVQLARATFAPDLLTTEGIPYRQVFDIVWSGQRHVIMGAAQIDRFGNQNIAFVGDARKPKAALLGMRGAPGNTINHTTSYWVPEHSRRVFVAKVDCVSGVGYDRAAALGPAARFHEIRRVVSDLGVFDFETPDHSMRIRSIHPGAALADVIEKTGFPLAFSEPVPVTRAPTDEETAMLRSLA